MKITNVFKLPETIVQMAKMDTYDPGHSNITVTGLIDSPRVMQLRKIHAAKREQDISEMLWMLLGTAMHHILETAKVPGTITEERLFIKVNGWSVSGQIDSQIVEPDGVICGDYKTCSVWSVIYGKESWVEQLNMYAYLVTAVKGLRVKSLKVYAICRDWKKREVQRIANYPKSPMVVIDIPLWSVEKQHQYLVDRLALHAEADLNRTLGEAMPLCSAQERWQRDPTYAVMKPGGKRAIRVFDTHKEAAEYSGSAAGTIIVKRDAESIRCTNNYCSVADFCDFGKQFKPSAGDNDGL